MDREEFEERLKELPQETVVLIAARAAVRSFPILTRFGEHDENSQTIALSTGRAILSSGVAAKFPTSKVIQCTGRASDAANAAALYAGHSHVADAVHAAVQAANTALASQAAGTTRAASANRAVALAARAATYAAVVPGDAVVTGEEIVVDTAYVEATVRTDALKDVSLSFDKLLSTPAWQNAGEPQWMVSAMASSDNLLDAGPEWDFWRQWYHGFLNGDQLDWELQRRVALIEENIWEAGPKAVAEEIARIEAEYLAEKAPQAERIYFDPETGRFSVVPAELAKSNLLGASLGQVFDALEDVLASPGNGISEASREARVLRRVFSKHYNDPQQIEMGFVSVHKGLTRQILASEDLPASEENLALMDALDAGAKAVRATHPEVAENRKIINDQAIKELPEGARETLEEALPILATISDGDLADDWQTDIPQLINDATLPLPTGAPPLPGVDESTRIFSRAAKISRNLRVDGVLTKIEESSGYRAASILGTIAGLVALGLSIF